MKFLIFLILLIAGQSCFAQIDNGKKLDSLKKLLTPEQLDSFNKFVTVFDNLDEPQYGWEASVSIYNGQLSSTTFLNAPTKYTNGALINTVLMYGFKSGVFVSYDNIIATAQSKKQLLQHTLSFGYEKQKTNSYLFNITALKTFSKDSGTFNPTPNDFGLSTTFKYLKTILEPTVILSYGLGRFEERVKVPITGRIRRGTAKIKSFSAIFGVQSSFDNYDNLNAKWSALFVPKILLNGGSQKYTSELPERVSSFANVAAGNNLFIQRNVTENFSFQSLGLDLEATFGKGNFYCIPSLYIDNSFLETDQFNRTSFYGNLTLGYTF